MDQSVMETDELLQDGLDSVSSLNEVDDFIKQKQINGEEITANESYLIQCQLKYIGRKLGYSEKALTIPSTESYSSKWVKVDRTAALENAVTDFISKVWEGIKAFFRKIFNWFKSFFNDSTSASSVSESVKEDVAVIENAPKEAVETADKAVEAELSGKPDQAVAIVEKNSAKPTDNPEEGSHIKPKTELEYIQKPPRSDKSNPEIANKITEACLFFSIDGVLDNKTLSSCIKTTQDYINGFLEAEKMVMSSSKSYISATAELRKEVTATSVDDLTKKVTELTRELNKISSFSNIKIPILGNKKMTMRVVNSDIDDEVNVAIFAIEPSSVDKLSSFEFKSKTLLNMADTLEKSAKSIEAKKQQTKKMMDNAEKTINDFITMSEKTQKELQEKVNDDKQNSALVSALSRVKAFNTLYTKVLKTNIAVPVQLITIYDQYPKKVKTLSKHYAEIVKRVTG